MATSRLDRHQSSHRPTQRSSSALIYLGTPVTALPRVGPAVAERLARLEIQTVYDLLTHWPRTWLDLTNPTPIAQLKQDQLVVLEGQLSDLRFDHAIGKRRAKVAGTITDADGDTLPVVWHNQAFLRRVLQNGQRWLFVGQVKWNWQEKCIQLSNPQRATQRAVLPIYPETAGISSAFIRSLIAPIVDVVAYPNALDSTKLSTTVMSFAGALRTMHLPETVSQIEPAKQRLALDESAHLQYQLLQQRSVANRVEAPAITPSIAVLQRVVAQLPFTLTPEQRRISWDIIQQLNTSEPLRHVLQGDVGTGKTIVGLLVAVSALEAGHDVYWMAPTQLLARQLRSRLTALIHDLPYGCALVTSTQKPQVTTAPTLYVGTQALLGFVQTNDAPALVIVDEQHRFGVAQQQHLLQQGSHLLTMTATPIPRALLLALYGNHHLSQLRFRPSTHAATTTIALRMGSRGTAVDQLRVAVARNEQGFIVVPRIEAGEDQRGAHPSLEHVKRLYQVALPKARIVAYHGQLSGDEQQTIMNRFLDGSIDVLVATSIVEVGLDVPNATVMVIEQADWFGLAQLHQLRGRVGRGTKPATCLLLYDDLGAGLPERLGAFCRSSDGFALAELDLKLRGPGDLLGELQSGWNRLRLADPTDTVLATRARIVAQAIEQQQPASLQAWLALYEKGEGGATRP